MYGPLTEQCMPEGAPVITMFSRIMNLGVGETFKSKDAIKEHK